MLFHVNMIILKHLQVYAFQFHLTVSRLWRTLSACAALSVNFCMYSAISKACNCCLVQEVVLANRIYHKINISYSIFQEQIFLCLRRDSPFPSNEPKSQQVHHRPCNKDQVISRGQGKHDCQDGREHGEAAVDRPCPGDEPGSR